MKRQRHTEEQIIQVLQEAVAGAKVEDLCRRHAITLTLSVAYDMVHCSPLHVRIGGGTARVFAETKE